MASIVLIFSHPLLSHPEATVRTCLVGQSRNLWNVGGHGLGILASKGLSLIVISGSGETESSSDENRLAILLGVSWGSGETETAPDGDPPATLVSGGSSASCHRRSHPDMTFQGAPFEAWRVGTRNGRAISPWLDGMFRLRNKCACAAGVRIGGSWRFEFFTLREAGDGCFPSRSAFRAVVGVVAVVRPFYKAGVGDLVPFLLLLCKKAPTSCLYFRHQLLHSRRAVALLHPKPWPALRRGLPAASPSPHWKRV